MTNTFIISWDMTGLEAVVDITQDLAAGELRDQEVLFDILKDPEANHGNEPWRKISNIIQSMTLRARANTQRHYEIYSIQTVMILIGLLLNACLKITHKQPQS